MKYTLYLAIAIVMITLSTATPAFPHANTAKDVVRCRNAMERLQVSYEQLDVGLLTYYENVNIRSEQAALELIEAFFSDVNDAELKCQERSHDAKEDQCREDFTIIRWSVQSAYQVITSSELEDLVTVKSRSVKQERIWRHRQDILRTFKEMSNSDCNMFSACQAFLTNYEYNLHTYLFARSIQDINGITKTLTAMANADSLSGKLTVASNLQAIGDTVGTSAQAVGGFPEEATPTYVAKTRLAVCHYMYNIKTDACIGAAPTAGNPPTAGLWAQSVAVLDLLKPTSLKPVMNDDLWAAFDKGVETWMQGVQAQLNGKCAFTANTVRPDLV